MVLRTPLVPSRTQPREVRHRAARDVVVEQLPVGAVEAEEDQGRPTVGRCVRSTRPRRVRLASTRARGVEAAPQPVHAAPRREAQSRPGPAASLIEALGYSRLKRQGPRRCEAVILHRAEARAAQNVAWTPIRRLRGSVNCAPRLQEVRDWSPSPSGWRAAPIGFDRVRLREQAAVAVAERRRDAGARAVRRQVVALIEHALIA